MNEENSAPVINENNESNEPLEPVINEALPAPAVKRKYKFKSDGEEYEEEYDDESITRQLSLAKAAQKRMTEASMTKRQAESFIQALKNDPMKVLSDERIMGNDKFRAIAEDFLTKQLEDQLLSPEEKSQRDREAKLKKYEEAEKEAMTKAEEVRLQKLEEHYSNEYQKTIMAALNTSSLPKNAFTVKRMASLMQKNLDHGLELPAEALAQIVKEDYQRELVSLIGGSDAAQILAMFGEDTVNKIRKHDLEKLRSGQIQPRGKSDNQSTSKEVSKTLTMSEWRAQNNR